MHARKGKIGIGADNYKLPEYRKRLDAAGLVYTETPFTPDVTLLSVLSYDTALIQQICQEVEAWAHRRRARNN